MTLFPMFKCGWDTLLEINLFVGLAHGSCLPIIRADLISEMQTIWEVLDVSPTSDDIS